MRGMQETVELGSGALASVDSNRRARAHTLMMNSGGSQRRVKQRRESGVDAVAASPASRPGAMPACRRCWEELSVQERQTAALLGFEQWSWDTRVGTGAPAPTPEPPPRKRRASSAAALEGADDAPKPTAPPPPPPRRGRAVAAADAAPAAAHTPGRAVASVVARAAAAAAPAAAASSKPAVGHPLRTSMAFKRPNSRKRGASHLKSEAI